MERLVNLADIDGVGVDVADGRLQQRQNLRVKELDHASDSSLRR